MKKIKFNIKRIICVLLCFFVSSVVILYDIQFNTVFAKTIQELEQEAAKLENNIKDLNNKLNNAATQIKNEKEKQKQLEKQISNTQEQILIYKQKIELVSSEITVKEKEIEIKLSEIKKTEEDFSKRIRVMYIANSSSSAIANLFSSKSFSDFLNRAETIKRISKSDNDLIKKLATQKEELIKAKKTLEKSKSDLESTRKTYSNKETNLNSLYKQSAGSESELLKLQKKYYDDKQKYSKQIKAIEAEVDRIIRENANNNPNGPSAAFKWPVPSSTRVTSPFGWRYIFGKQELHSGLDIGASKGSAVVASNSGTVILATKSSYGYGWHIVVDHGGGYATLYGHLSRIDVSVGQAVARGSTIGGVGSTGNSTGNHLHFEVRINGVKKNPMAYL